MMALQQEKAPLTSIVIPTYNRCELLRSCVEAIHTYTHTPYEIIVVDNGSTDQTLSYCLEEGLTCISLPSNTGFPYACNAGMRLSSGDVVTLLNNDVIVAHRWLDQLLAALMSEPQIGIVGPVTNYASGKQQVHHPYDTIEQFQHIAYKVNQKPDPSKWLRVQRVVGLCFVMKRAVVERIGYLDERFSPGHYEDDDYCLRAKMNGFQLVVCEDALVHHYGSHSFKEHGQEQLDQLIARNYERFKEKWSVDPHQFI
ncbi:glycosyltransferase family 2 protein [Paenibacillus agilis]|nr:glycosyltransferase family 2 protein [Paenibacillus agilis]